MTGLGQRMWCLHCQPSVTDSHRHICAMSNNGTWASTTTEKSGLTFPIMLPSIRSNGSEVSQYLVRESILVKIAGVVSGRIYVLAQMAGQVTIAASPSADTEINSAKLLVV